VCKQIYAEMSKMQAAAFRNYWIANTFKVELCNSSFGGSDFIAEGDLQHINHIAYTCKRMCDGLVLHFVFKESWNLAIEAFDSANIFYSTAP
jgi:hypothetical protein